MLPFEEEDQAFKITVERGQEKFTLEADDYGFTTEQFIELILPFILSSMKYPSESIEEVMERLTEEEQYSCEDDEDGAEIMPMEKVMSLFNIPT